MTFATRRVSSLLSTSSRNFGTADGVLIQRTFRTTARGFRTRLLRLVDDLTAGRIDLHGFNRAAGRIVKTEFGITFALGALSVDPFHTLTIKDIRAIDAEVDQQKTFLRSFAKDVVSGDLVLHPVVRAGFYLQALRGMFELGRIEALPLGPYDWILGIAEHCIPCLQTSQQGPYQKNKFSGLGLPELPGVPGSGDICNGLTRCACKVRLAGGLPLPNEDLQDRVREILLEVLAESNGSRN